VAVVALDNMLAAYYDGKQIAIHRLSYQKQEMVVNAAHYRRSCQVVLEKRLSGSEEVTPRSVSFFKDSKSIQLTRG
jgi:hypothetical protein